MLLQRRSLKNFRCYLEKQEEISPRLILLIGASGSGKTAILEGNNRRSPSRRLRSKRDPRPLNHGQELCDAAGGVTTDGERKDVHSACLRRGLKSRFNNQRPIKTPGERPGKVPVAMLFPEEGKITSGAQRAPRAFMGRFQYTKEVGYLSTSPGFREALSLEHTRECHN